MEQKKVRTENRIIKRPALVRNENMIINRYIIKKLIGRLVKKGKRVLIFNKIRRIFLKLRLVFNFNAFILFHLVYKRLIPLIETIYLKKRGRIVPFSVAIRSSNRQQFLTYKYFFTGLNMIKNLVHFEDRFIREVYDILNKKGRALPVKRDSFKDLLKNKSVFHYRWAYKRRY